MKVIGLTGGIASGKSTVANILRDLGVPVFDADAASRSAVDKGTDGLQRVIEALGDEYLTQEQELDRAKIAKLVFSNQTALRKLESIIHEIVWQQITTFLSECLKQQVQVVVLDVPLLIECSWYNRVDVVWLVIVDKETQIQRAAQRNGMKKAEVEARIAVQMTLEEKYPYADLVIDNSGTLADTEIVVKKAWAEIISMEC